LNNSNYGSSEDIKSIIQEQYGIDIPVVIVRKLIKAVENSFSKKEKNQLKFQIYSNGNNFQIGKYAFTELEEKYRRSKRNANVLQKAFEAYQKEEAIDVNESPSFVEFLDKNKNRLASFFATGHHVNGDRYDKLFIYHVQFLEYIEINNHELYKIAENIYLGSIVAGFLEAGLEMEAKFSSNEVYYLDTPIVLRALNLQKDEETKPVLELLNLIKNTGGEIKVLSITIDEIHGILEKAITTYNNTTPTSTINEAVLRIQKNKPWLITLNGKLEDRLKQEFNISIVQISQAHKEKWSKSPDIKALKEARFRKGSAEHDVWSYLYVRERRHGNVASFQKAKEWFLTTNKDLLNFNVEKAMSKGVSETILPDVLTSLLWLKNPSQLVDKVKSVGLSELMAITLEEEIASKELINEFHSNLRQIEGLVEEDYVILLESVAHQSAKNIERLNELIVQDDKQTAKIEAQKIVEKERKRRKQTQEKIKEAQNQERATLEKNSELLEKLSSIENELKNVTSEKNVTKTKLESLASAFESETKKSEKRWKALFFASVLFLVLILFLLLKDRAGSNFSLITGGVCLFVSIPIYYYREKLNSIVLLVLASLSSSGWIWGLGSFIINLLKLLFGKQ
jgi:hypothetical protein